MTPKEIFEKNQVLTLAIAKTLIGKRIAITNSEYYMNAPMVREFVLTGIETLYDGAAKEECRGYGSLQDYWNQKLQHKLPEFQRIVRLVGDGEKPYAKCDPLNGYFKEPTFYGSDADRAIYYIVIE